MRLIPEFFSSSPAVRDAFITGPTTILRLYQEYMLPQYHKTQECLMLALAATERLEHPRQYGYARHLLEEKSDLDFFRNLRLTRETFAKLVTTLNEEHQARYPGGFLPLTNEECLMVTLWYLGNKCSYREISEQFGYSEGCIFQSVQIVLDILCGQSDNYIKWPTPDEALEIEKEFKSVAGFPGVIGAIDGCHIEVKAPDDVQADYIDRNNRHSINLLAVCDHNKKFTYIDAGFPGSAHDSRVYRCSTLGRTIESNASTLMPSTSHHIIGDSGFQLSTYLLTPYRDYGHLTHTQRKYNTKLSQTRVVIENSFGWLKGRFRRLKYVDAEIDKITQIVKACCVLHNISLANPQEGQYLAEEVPEASGTVEAIYNVIHLPEVEGREKRDFIASLL